VLLPMSVEYAESAVLLPISVEYAESAVLAPIGAEKHVEYASHRPGAEYDLNLLQEDF
jgi:hypothetical protein